MISSLEKFVNKTSVKIGTALFGVLFAYKLATAHISQEAYAHEEQENMRYEAYIKLGGMAFKDGDIPEGHKSWINAGLDATFGTGNFKLKTNAEIGGMFEPVDDDPELPQTFYILSTKASYYFPTDTGFTFYPFAKLGFNRWLRNENPKHKDGFGELSFLSGNIGIGAKYRSFYAETGVSLPVWSQTNYSHNPSGKVGFNAALGLEWKRLHFEILYEQTRFSQDGTQPGFELNQYGARLGIKF